MICGDILDEEVYSSLVSAVPEKIDFLLASPPCQGMSVAGKNRTLEQMCQDERNFLIFRIIDFIKLKNPDYVMIENVPQFLRMELPFMDKKMKVTEILASSFHEDYIIDAKDKNVPQRTCMGRTGKKPMGYSQGGHRTSAEHRSRGIIRHQMALRKKTPSTSGRSHGAYARRTFGVGKQRLLSSKGKRGKNQGLQHHIQKD